MSNVDFAKVIMGEIDAMSGKDPRTYTAGTPTMFGTAIANGITKYITGKVKISIAWTGATTTTPPTPDPVTSDVASVVGVCAPIMFASDFNAWIKTIETNIVSGFFVGPSLTGITPTGTINAFLPGLVVTQPELRSAAESNEDDPRTPFWEKMCGRILEWLEKCTVASYPGVHGAYVGVATWTKTIT